MTNGRTIKWDVKRGYSVYQSVFTETLQKWIKEGKVSEGELFVWTSGMSGWRRPEELYEFRSLFEKKKRKREVKEKIEKRAPIIKKKKRDYLKITIIDDEKEINWLLGNALKKRRFIVSSAETGREGLELVKRERPDVVLLDLRLKDVDGLNVLRKIKEVWHRIKVIIISAFGGPLVREKATGLGADGFVDKPFKPEDIVKAIKKL